ncbi:MAG: beta-ketoacyl-ACP synthase II [Rickettsiaceae bacterium]|nr:beta-ketoacyl-ACP synthase II [Rickettsiaceae bacterium]
MGRNLERRVVVTGVGAVTPLGIGVKNSWDNLLSCKSGIGLIDRFDISNFESKIAGLVKDFSPDLFINPADVRKMDHFIHYGIAAASEAVVDSGIDKLSEEEKENIGVLTGSGIGGLKNLEDTSLELKAKGRVNPFFIPSTLINLLAGHISIKYGFMGPNHSVVTACATGTHAIGDASRMIKYGDADIVVAGGAEAAVTPLGMAGFYACRALSTNFNDNPVNASRPWDKARDGFVIAEGSGILVLEEYQHALKRGAKIYGEIVGYGMSGDANHITRPHPEAIGAMRAMERALGDAKIDKDTIDYINAHGTSTPAGDELELLAVQKLFDGHLHKMCMSSTKSSIGHMLGAAGAVEAIFSLLAMQNGIAPATLNLENPLDSLDIKIDLVANKPKEKTIRYCLSNSFGFGGTNASIILKSV